jgi:hypothetical protein
MQAVIILLLLLLTSCGPQKDPREALKETPTEPKGPTRSIDLNNQSGSGVKCIDGASYDLLYGGAFLQYKDGKYVTC